MESLHARGKTDREKEEEMTAREFWQQVESFHVYNRSRNLSPDTITTYTSNLEMFRRWLRSSYGDESAPITTRRIREYMADKLTLGCKPNTVRCYLITLQAFFSFLEMDGAITEEENPTRKVKPPRVPQEQIVPLTIEQIKALLGSFDKRSFTGYRDYVACLLMLDSGLRISEVIRLDIEDVDLERSRLKANGKGAKFRFVYIGERTKARLEKYITLREWHTACTWPEEEVSALFVRSLRRSPGARMGRRYLGQRIMERMDAAGIPRMNSSAHRLRHTFAVNFLRNGGGALHLQRLLGHSTLEMTRKYILLADGDLAEAHKKASPLDRLDL